MEVTFVVTIVFFFFFNDTATTEIYTLSLHDALPISPMKISPPAVTIEPPRFNDPHLSDPGSEASSGICPRGTSHRMEPFDRSTARSVPHGGGLHGPKRGTAR